MQKIFSFILWVVLPLVFLATDTYIIWCIAGKSSHYSREGMLIEKNEGLRTHKSTYYTDYYFTVKWYDYKQEKEVFQVSPEVFFYCKENEKVTFVRLKPEYEWVHNIGTIFFLSSTLMFLFLYLILYPLRNI